MSECCPNCGSLELGVDEVDINPMDGLMLLKCECFNCETTFDLEYYITVKEIRNVSKF